MMRALSKWLWAGCALAAIAAYVESIEREGDAILLNAPNQWEVFTYYHHQHVPVYPLNRTRPPIEARGVAELEEIAAKHDRHHHSMLSGNYAAVTPLPDIIFGTVE